MISLKSKREIQTIQEAAEILKKIFLKVEPVIKAGVTTDELDQIASKVIKENGGEPAFKGYRGFPKVACISVNEEVVHGIPGKRKLENGDLISFDIGAKVDGFYADAARTWAVGEISPVKRKLMETAKASLYAGLGQYRPGCRIGDLSAAIGKYIEAQGFQVVREYVGHGIGRQLHEDPQVPNYGKPGMGPKIEAGLVIAIEPMVTEGHHAVETLDDGWTVATKDGKWASHYEDTIVFLEDGYKNLTGE